MPQPQFSDVLSRLHTDRDLRQRFAASPAAVLRELGFDPDMLALPARIDPARLEKRLNQVFTEGAASLSARPAEVAHLSPDELWERFNLIGLKPEAGALAGPGDVSIVVAVVVYGVSMVTSGAGTQVTTVGKGTGVRSLAQLKQLRDLSRQPAKALTFSVSGPDGTAVHGIPADVLKAFLERIR